MCRVPWQNGYRPALCKKGKETMRRLFAMLLALGLVGTVVGCKHICGVCDCDPYIPCATGCCGGAIAPAPPAPGAPVITPEPIQQMPKQGE
jgi:hypothetical protein